MTERVMCKRLEEVLKTPPFFDVVGGCGVDVSGGESHCMSSDGVWFKFCPFCGRKIEAEWEDGSGRGGRWSWWEV